MPQTSPAETVAEFRRVSKTFGEGKAVADVSFAVRRGEFFSLLGPSGCGKTTSLRLLAGFEEPDPDGGMVLIGGAVMNGRRPYERDVAMVFQNYALFPHLTVERNIAFGLEQRRVPRSEIGGRVEHALTTVRLDPSEFSRRMPGRLSGGQRQRVALARALVVEPSILLLDEPLGALDLQLRKEMQRELRALNRELGITFIYVTHDQDEALAMSDRIVVMDRARVAQIGTPAEIYERPQSAFVATFIGASNLLEGKVAGLEHGRLIVALRNGETFSVPGAGPGQAGAPVQVVIRPERMSLVPAGEPAIGNTLAGTVREVVYHGGAIQVLLRLGTGADVLVALRNDAGLPHPLPWAAGTPARVRWRPEDGRLLSAPGNGE